jgi:hypothetical protein
LACASAIRASACSRAWRAKKSASVMGWGGSGSLRRGRVSSEVEGRVPAGEGVSCSGWKHYISSVPVPPPPPYPEWFCSPPSLLSKGYWVFFPKGQSSWGMKLSTRPNLMMSLRMGGALLPLSHISSRSLV